MKFSRGLVLAVTFGLLASQPMPAAERPIRIGIVVDGPWAFNEFIQTITVQEITVLTEGEFDVQFPPESYLIGDWSYGTVERNLQILLDDPEVDLVITWGLLASNAVCCLDVVPKPVIAPVVIDPVLQGLPFADGASGVPNVNYVALPDNLAEDLTTFRGIVGFEHVAIITNNTLIEAVPELAERTRQTLAGTGIGFEYVPATDSASEVLAAISPRADAVYVWPLFQFSQGEYGRLIQGFIDRGLPSFSGLGGADVEAGMLASAGSPEFFPKIARRIALNVQRILLGEDAGTIPVSFSAPDNLVINMATARAIDASPRWEVLIEAKLLHPEELEGAYHLSLEKAVSEAILVNLDLAVRKRVVAAGAENVAIARSALRPQFDVSATSLTVDNDRAEASFGSQAERSVTGSVGLTQLLYSDAALANTAIQKRLQEEREHGFLTLRLDIALEASTTYLNLMRAKALERVQRNNVDRTRSNLDLAQVRRQIGVASTGEVLRWESELATARKSLVEAVGNRKAAEIGVNRLLHRPLEDAFVTEEVKLETAGFLTGEDRFRQYTETPKGYQVFRDFLVLEGLSQAPELDQLDAGIAAQQRFLTAARRSFWAPTIALQAGLDEIVSKGGAGSDVTSGPLGLPTADDSSWSLAFNATLPLFAGGLRAAERTQAEFELERLQLERSAVGEKIEQRIRTGLQQARASFAGIALSNQAADAAQGALDLVEDAYARGVASLLDLLDAQTASLNAEELAANALYDFLIDWLDAQRAANSLDFFIDETERRAWFERLDAYVAARGTALRPVE